MVVDPALGGLAEVVDDATERIDGVARLDDPATLTQRDERQKVDVRGPIAITETFRGSVSQVRLNPTTVQNVVTYNAIIDAPNPDP